MAALLDHAGPAFTNLISGVLTVCGCAVLGWSSSFVAGYALVAFGGAGVFLAATHLIVAFPKRESMVFSCIYGELVATL